MVLLRVRTNVGLWRVDSIDVNKETVDSVVKAIKATRPNVVFEKPLSLDPSCAKPLDCSKTLAQQGLAHGSMIHCRVVPETTVDVSATDAPDSATAPASGNAQRQGMRKIIGKDGQIKLVPSSEVTDSAQDKGFRKGQMALRDMKMSWTLNDFIELDSQFEFKMQRQEKVICQQVSLDVPSITDFQAYLQSFQFQRNRFGFLYGKFIKQNDDDEKPTKVLVEAIYEPPQEHDPEGFIPLDDPTEETVDQIAEMLGLQKVGWIFGHTPRDKDIVMTSGEVIMAAEYQLEAAEGVEETPFVTVKVTKNMDDGIISVEAFQVSQQCMAMVAEQALEVGEDPKECVVNETFTAIQEGKPSKTVANDFFLCVVPIVQHTSQTFVADFPRVNRDVDTRTPSHDEMKKQLQKSGTAGWTFTDQLADFNLLIYLSKFLDMSADMPKICQSIAAKQDIGDGYKLIIKSMAGMEGSY